MAETDTPSTDQPSADQPELRRTDPPGAPGGPEADELTRTVSVIRVGLRGLYRSQLPRMAAALAYRTIFSVIPVLAIVLVIASSFVEPEQVRTSFTRMLEYAGFETISVSSDQVEAPGVRVAPSPDAGQPVTPPAGDENTGHSVVSYTQLTQPTNHHVEISVAPVALQQTPKSHLSSSTARPTSNHNIHIHLSSQQT